MALAHSIRVTYIFIYQKKLEIVTERKMHMKKKTWFIRYNNNGKYDKQDRVSINRL